MPRIETLILALAAGAVAACAPLASAERQGAVEIFVKEHHPALLSEIGAGGGPRLSEAMALAGVPEADRPARAIQLRGDAGLFAANPMALVLALTLYGR